CSGEPGGNRTHNPQTKSHSPITKTLVGRCETEQRLDRKRLKKDPAQLLRVGPIEVDVHGCVFGHRDGGLIFAKEWGDLHGRADSLGGPLQINNLGQREFNPMIKTAGVRRIKFHGLRHTVATLMRRGRARPSDASCDCRRGYAGICADSEASGTRATIVVPTAGCDSTTRSPATSFR